MKKSIIIYQGLYVLFNTYYCYSTFIVQFIEAVQYKRQICEVQRCTWRLN